MFNRSRSVRALAVLFATLAFAVFAPVGQAEATMCVGVAYNGQQYCASTLGEVKTGAYPVGTRVALQNLSVTARTTSSLTVAAWEVVPCPPGYFCGATMNPQSLTVAWTGQSRPAVGSVINLFGTTGRGALTPVGYTPDLFGCYIDYC
jgi:hypothetical protein